MYAGVHLRFRSPPGCEMEIKSDLQSDSHSKFFSKIPTDKPANSSFLTILVYKNLINQIFNL